jgi:hypothetical protein
MVHRDLSEVASKLHSFLTEDPACIQAVQCLGKSVEIGIVIAETIDGAFFKAGNKAEFELRPAKNPDVIFMMSASAIDVLTEQKNLSLGNLGVEVLKQIVGGEIKIKVKGSLFSILKNGYLNIIKEAGAPFAQFLAEKGISSLSKIPDLIAKMRK